jgi:hypothetical protein
MVYNFSPSYERKEKKKGEPPRYRSFVCTKSTVHSILHFALQYMYVLNIWLFYMHYL